jgi:hypothetical protein
MTFVVCQWFEVTGVQPGDFDTLTALQNHYRFLNIVEEYRGLLGAQDRDVPRVDEAEWMLDDPSPRGYADRIARLCLAERLVESHPGTSLVVLAEGNESYSADE